MELSSFLLGKDAAKAKGKVIDSGLDDIFRSTVVAPGALKAGIKPPTAFMKPTAERKRKDVPESPPPHKSAKRAKQISSKPIPAVPSPKPSVKPAKKAKKAARDSEDEEAAVVEDASHDSSDEETEEPIAGPSSSKGAEAQNSSDKDEEDSDEDGDPSQLVHESLAKGSKSQSSAKKTKYVPSEETPEQRDTRTIFIGNVPIDVVKSRPLQKQLKRHIQSFVPTAKIESARFRSVAFSKPTALLPDDNSAAKEARQHNRDRAASWRESKSRNDEEAAADRGKSFLTPQEKKRIYAITQELHTGVDSVNAYVVFAHPPPASEKHASTVMDPYEAAKLAIKEADGSLFNGHTIRVDTAAKGKGKGKIGGVGAAGTDLVGDPKATVFVGSLDFASKEEDVRAFFEKLMVEEKGVPGAGENNEAEEDEEEEEDDDEEEEGKATTKGPPRAAWVKRVRIIRDKDTLLGKGFCYVQFTDRACVDEILALEETRLKFAKRKLRVQRCKTLPGASKPVRPTAIAIPGQKSPSTASARPARPRPTGPIVVPKGDPTLGTKLASLSKEDRKKVKASDADRVARRLAKKQAKALAEKGVKSRGDVGKDRERVRKRPAKDRAGGSGGPPEKRKVKPGRVRSGKALSKMNVKK